MGLPSYAHPRIGEWNVLVTSLLELSILKSATPYLVLSNIKSTSENWEVPVRDLPYKDSLNFLGA